MRIRISSIVIIISATLLLIVAFVPYKTVLAQYQLEYTIQIRADGSAIWTIKQTGTNIQISTDTYVTFVEKVRSLVEAAQNQTGRNMTVDENSFKLSTDVSGSYAVVRYQFDWINFSKIEGPRIITGDVFEVENVFLRLYGDGAVYIMYPSQYIIETVSPTPNDQNMSLQMVEWFGIKDFTRGEPKITLMEKSASPGFIDMIRQNTVLIIGLVAPAAGFLAVLYIFKFRNKKMRGKKSVKTSDYEHIPAVEDDEDRVIRLLKSAGGSLYQSALADQCKFSRAKTSQLLTTLENKAIIKRYKKGRGKVVILQNETGKT